MSDKTALNHTRAPWEAELRGIDTIYERWNIGNAEAGNDIVCEVSDYVDTPAERDANAAIIKAAPEMYALLRKVAGGNVVSASEAVEILERIES